MMSFRSSLRLIRFDKPVGTLLLWFPTAWALWLAHHGMPPIKLLLLFFLGTFLMRSAGCVVNDIADRRIDSQVQRTRGRPLASGEISISQAIFLFLSLLTAAWIVLIQLPKACFIWALAALVISMIYPLCKRFFKTPQLVLGLAFSMGIPMAFVASNKPIDGIVLLLFAINFFWIIAYDTMYAMADKADDLLIGVHSTAVTFGDYERVFIGLMLTVMHLGWILLGYLIQAPLHYYLLWLLALMVLMYQQKLITSRNPTECFKAFKVSVYYGALMWMALVVSLS
jgi:4-hydroxybenzoate polyprenyltransferase